MYFISAEEQGNMGHKANIVIESPFLIASCVLHFWKAWSSGGWADQSSACFFFLCLITRVNFSTCQVHGGLWNFKAISMLCEDHSHTLDFWVHPEMNKSWSRRKLQLKNPNLMLAILYLASCDFKQELGLEVVHTWSGDQQKEKKKVSVEHVFLPGQQTDIYWP